MMTAVALTIAGSDSGGGAGVQADLKTFAAFGVFGTSVITALTAQNTVGVRAIAAVEASFVGAQFDAVAEDLEIKAAKTGMLARRAVIEIVADRIRAHRIVNLVVDPVIVAASGDVLMEADAIAAMRDLMLPLARIVTPNVREAEVLTGMRIDDANAVREAAQRITAMGARAALIKGGRRGGPDSIDVLHDGRAIREFRARRVPVTRAHGTGCTLSAAIAASFALGLAIDDAVDVAKRYVTRALESAARIGHGATPLNHLVKPDRM